MIAPPLLHSRPEDLADAIAACRAALTTPGPSFPRGLCGFDGFVDTFIRMRRPASMAEFGPKVTAAAGIAASYEVEHQGDKFGGNGPLFAGALSDLFSGELNQLYIGGIGEREVEPIFSDALAGKARRLVPLAASAHSDCLEFSDGKIMLSDFRACDRVTLSRLLEVMGADALDTELAACDFISAVNWGKLPHAGEIWSYLAERLEAMGRGDRSVWFFMDLAEFEHRTPEEIQDLLNRLPVITRLCRSILSLNLKEAWQLAAHLGENFHGRKQPGEVAELAGLLRDRVKVERLVIHPNHGAACADGENCVFVPGPHCRDPLISTGAGDHFGAGCLAAALRGLDLTGMLLTGNAASGYFVRSGRSPSFADVGMLLDRWAAEGSLAERL